MNCASSQLSFLSLHQDINRDNVVMLISLDFVTSTVKSTFKAPNPLFVWHFKNVMVLASLWYPHSH